MSTSGSVDFTLNRDQIIVDALQLVGVLGVGQTPTAEQIDLVSRALNMMVKTWQGEGIKVWGQSTATVFLVEGQASYVLSSTGANASNSVVSTALSSAAASGASTVYVDSVTGITAADYAGLVLDDDTIDWNTVSAVSGTALTVEFTNAISGAADTDNAIYTYTSKVNRPLEIVNVYIKDESGKDTTIEPLSRQEYEELSDKTVKGVPNSYWYDKQLTARIYLWPTPENDSDYRLMVTHRRPLEDFDSSSDDPDFPQEWIETLVYNLATRIAPRFGRSLSQDVKDTAAGLKYTLEGWDVESTSVFFMPDSRW